MTTRTTSKQIPVAAERRHVRMTVRKLIDQYFYRIDLDADYQREKVWSKANQEELIDSIVKGIDIPKLYLAEVEDNKQFEFECIDGKQRLLTLSSFLKPDKVESSPLTLDIHGKKYTFTQLLTEHPTIAKWIEDYELDFVFYKESSLSDEFTRLIFRRLQLGIRLNSGELLKSQIGTIRDFVFKEIGKDGPFLRHTKLSDKRFSRQFTLAQICINSFHRARHGDFARARLQDLEDFFGDESTIGSSDKNLERIRKVLLLMDSAFGDKAHNISSRAVAVSAFLFVENLLTNRRSREIGQFVQFFLTLLDLIASDMDLVSKRLEPKNTLVLDKFQKYVLQASVEPYSIRSRDDFLTKAFAYYLKPGTKKRILGSK